MKIRFNPLSSKSTQEAITKLQKYQQTLKSKNEIFVDRLVEVARTAIEERVNSAGITVGSNGIQSGSDTAHSVTKSVATSNGRTTAIIKLSGKEVLFIEFGAGVYYNGSVGGSPNPKGTQLGMTIGSYGQGYGKLNVWGYTDDNGEHVVTHGTKATMPMYFAMEAIKSNYMRVGREVFGK